MSRGFNLTAELNLRGPANIGTIVADIRRQLGTVTADVTVRVNPAATQNINALNQSLNQLNATLRNTAAFAGASTTSIQNFTRAVQAAVTASANLPNNMTAAANATNNLTQNANRASRATNQITSEFQEFGRQAALAVRRFAALATVTSVIYGVSNAISSASKEFLDFNRELVRVSQVTDTSVKFLDGLVNRISSLSVGLGVSSKELIMVSSTLAQAGLTAKDTEKALQALALSALAPSFDSMNETVEGSIALMRQFGISAGDLEKALGSVNAVAAKFAVEASDIITAIQRTGGVFATSSKGVAEGTEALNQFIAVFTSVRATTRESAETIATGLRTIFTRIQRADTIDALKAYGVALTDLSGKFVGPYEAVKRLSEGLSQLDPRDLKFSRIVEELGGFRQIGKVIPLIQQLSVTQQAYAVAQRGQASLVNDAATAQQALAIRMTKVREEFIAMVRSIGQSEGFQTFVKLSLDLASALIKITDSAKGALPALTAIAAIRGAGFVSQFATGFIGGLRRRHDGGPIQKFARGGFVPGSGDGDTVPAMLEPGEFVIRKRAVQTIGASNLHRMNKYGGGGKVSTLTSIKPSLKSRYDTGRKVYDEYEEPIIDRKLLKTSRLAYRENAEEIVGRASDIYKTGRKTKAARSIADQYISDQTSGLSARLTKKDLTTTTEDNPRRLNKVQGALAEQDVQNKLRGARKLNYAGGADFVVGKDNTAFVEVKNKKESTDNKELIAKALLGYAATNASGPKYFNNKQANTVPPLKISLFSSNPEDLKYHNSGGQVQRFMAGSLVKRGRKPNPISEITLNEAKQRSASDIIKELTISEANLITGGVDARTILKKMNPSPLDQNLKTKLLTAYVEKINKRASDARGQGIATDAAATEQGLMFGAVGMFGKSFPSTTLRLSTGLQNPTDVQVVGYALDQNKAARKARLASKNPNDPDYAGVASAPMSSDLKKTWTKEQQISQSKQERGRVISAVMAELSGGTGTKAFFDFDRTLSFGSDKIGAKQQKGQKPDYSAFSDPDQIEKGLSQATPSALFFKLKKLTDRLPEILSNIHIVTARPQNTTSFIAKWLASKGLPVLSSNVVGVGGSGKSSSGVAIDKANAIAGLSGGGRGLFVDDDAKNVEAVKQLSNISSYQYGGKKYTPTNKAMADIQGHKFEELLKGAIPPELYAAMTAPTELNRNKSVDFPYGLGAQVASDWFNAPMLADIPTDAKRTLNGPSGKIQSNITNYLKARGYKDGGEAEDYTPQQLVSLAKYRTGPFPSAITSSEFINRYLEDKDSFMEYLKTFHADPPKAYDATKHAAKDMLDMFTTKESMSGSKRSGKLYSTVAGGKLKTILTQINNPLSSNKDIANAIGKNFNLNGSLLSTSESPDTAAVFQPENGSSAMLSIFRDKKIPSIDVDKTIFDTSTEDNVIKALSKYIDPGSGKNGADFLSRSRSATRIEQEFILPPSSKFRIDDIDRIYSKDQEDKLLGGKIRHIEGMKVQQFASGGHTEDTVPALLTPGEFVINRKAAQSIGLSRLHKLNHADKIPGFNKGGPVGVQTFADGGYAPKTSVAVQGVVRQTASGAPMQSLSVAMGQFPIAAKNFITELDKLDLPIEQAVAALKTWTISMNSGSNAAGAMEAAMASASATSPSRSQQVMNRYNSRYGPGPKATTPTPPGTAPTPPMPPVIPPNNTPGVASPTGAAAAVGGRGGLAGRLGSGLMSKMGNLGNAGMAMAFMGPMIGEGASKLIGGKTGAGIGGAAANFSSAFSVGSQFGAIGAFVGALAGAVSAVDGFAHGITQYEDEISQKKIDTENNKASKNIEALGKNPRDVAATQALVKNAQVIAAEEQKRMENATQLRKPGMVSNALQTAAEYASLGFYKRAEPDKGAIAAEEAAINKNSQENFMSAISAKVSGGIDFKTAVSQVGGGNSDFVKQQIAEADAVTKAKLNQIEETRKVETDPALIKNLDDKRRAIINASFMEQTAIIQATAAEQEKAKKAKALAVTMNQASVSIARTFSNMNQSLNVAALKISEASNSIDEILSGKSSLKTDFASQKAILENPGAFSEKERQGAVKQVSGFFGQDEKFVRGLSDFGSNAQDTITKIASAAQQSGSGNAAEDISRSLTDQLIRTFGDNRITESMRQQISNSIKSQTEKGDGIDPQKLIDEADGLKVLIDANKQALETTLKIYSTVGEALNMYSDAVEKASELQNKVVERNAALANTLSGLNVKVKELFGRRVTVGEKISGRMTEATIRAGVQPGQLNPVALSAQRDAFAQQQQIAKQNFENAKKGDIANPAVIAQITKAAAALAEWNRKLVSSEQSIENLPGVIQSNIEDILNTVGQKIAERESMVQAGAGFSEKLVTSTPEELQGLNSTFNLLNNTLAGNITTFQNSAIAQKAYNDAITSGSTTMEAMSAAQTAFANENKNAMSMFSEMIQISGLDKSNPDKARNMRADLLENFAKAQGMNVGNNPMFNQMIAALRAKPEDNPEIKNLMNMYETQKQALIDATQAANQLLVDKQAQVLTTAGNAVVEALRGVTVKFDEAQLRMMGLNIQRPGNVMGRAEGGMVYASSGKFIPRGTDTVPAMLSPGEFVINSKATKNNLPLLSAINRSGGGIIPEYLAAGSRSPQSSIPVTRSPLSNLPTSFRMSQEWWLNNAIDQYGFDHPITQKVAKRFGINNVQRWAAGVTDDPDVYSYRQRLLSNNADEYLSNYGDNYNRMMSTGNYGSSPTTPAPRGINLRRDAKELGSWIINRARGAASGVSSFGSRLAGAGRAVVDATKGPMGIGMGIQAASSGLRYLAGQAGAPEWAQGAIGFTGEAAGLGAQVAVGPTTGLGASSVRGPAGGLILTEMAIQGAYEAGSAIFDNQNYVKRKNEEIQSQMGTGIEPTGITRLGSNIVGNIFGTDASVYSPSTWIPGRGIPAAIGRTATAFAGGVGSSMEAATIENNINSRNKANEEYTTFELRWARLMSQVRIEKEKAMAANDAAKIAHWQKQEDELQAERYSKTDKVGWLWNYKVDNELFKPGGAVNDTRLEARVQVEIAERKAENARQEQQEKDRQQEAANARQAAADDKAAAEAAKAEEERNIAEKQKEEKKRADEAAQSARDRAIAAETQKKEREKQYEFDQAQIQAENSTYAKLAKNGPVVPAIKDLHRRDVEQVRRLQAQAANETDPRRRAQLNKEIREAKKDVINLNDKESRDPKTNELYTQKQLDAKWRVYEKGEIKKQKAEATQAAKQKASLYLAVAKATGNMIPNTPEGLIRWKSRVIDKLQKKFFLSGRTSSDIDLLTKYNMAPEVAKMLLRPMDSDLSDVVVDIMAQQSGKGGGYKYSDNELKSLRMKESDIVAQREKLYKGDARSRLDAQLNEKDRKRLEVEKEKTLLKTLRGSRSFENVASRALNSNARFRGTASNNLIKKLTSQGIIDPRGDDVTNASKLRLLGMENSASLLYPKVPGGNANLIPATMNNRGGVIYASTGKLINFTPKGTDTVPAMLTPGEFVVNARSTSQHLPLLKAINSSKGGDVKHLNNGGVVYAQKGKKINNEPPPMMMIDIKDWDHINMAGNNGRPQFKPANEIAQIDKQKAVLDIQQQQMDSSRIWRDKKGKMVFGKLKTFNPINQTMTLERGGIDTIKSRKWIDSTGQYSKIGKLISMSEDGSSVVIQSEQQQLHGGVANNSGRSTVQVNKLSKEDQDYLKEPTTKLRLQTGMTGPVSLDILSDADQRYMKPISNLYNSLSKKEAEVYSTIQKNANYLGSKNKEEVNQSFGPLQKSLLDTIKNINDPSFIIPSSIKKDLTFKVTELQEKLNSARMVAITKATEREQKIAASYSGPRPGMISMGDENKEKTYGYTATKEGIPKQSSDYKKQAQVLLDDLNRRRKEAQSEVPDAQNIIKEADRLLQLHDAQKFNKGGVVYAQEGSYIPFKSPRAKALNDRKLEIQQREEEIKKGVQLDNLRKQLNNQLLPADKQEQAQRDKRMRRYARQDEIERRQNDDINPEEIKFAVDMIEEYKRFQAEQAKENARINAETSRNKKANTINIPPLPTHLQPRNKMSGGMVYASAGTLVPYQPKGTDTVPAMLTPGEFVVNAKSTAKNLPLLRSINRQNGGIVNYLEDGGEARSRKQLREEEKARLRQQREEEKARLRQQYQDTKLMKQESYYSNTGRSVPAKLSYSLADLKNRQQEKMNGSSSDSPGGASSSSPGILELTMFKKAITGTTDLLDRLNKTLTTITNQPNGVSNTAGNGLNLDGLTAFTQKFGEFTVALGKINPIINMKGEHTVNVNINGIEAFKTMQQEFQNLVTVEIQKSMNALSANSEGSIPVQNIG